MIQGIHFYFYPVMSGFCFGFCLDTNCFSFAHVVFFSVRTSGIMRDISSEVEMTHKKYKFSSEVRSY